jgi:16S rRNA (cytidine1402-2'-O)-methyltransferase
MPGTLFVVGTPIGNLEDITARALRVLGEVALIAAEDTRRTAHLLARYSIATRTTSLHAHNEGKKTAALLNRLLAGDSVALVSDAGTPTVSDPGQHLIAAAIARGIRVEPVPGPSAALAALSASGLSSDTFLFLGFPPTKAGERRAWFDALKTAGRTVVFFEAPHRIVSTLAELLGTIGDAEIVVARELTKTHETLVKGHIGEVLSRLGTPRGELTVVVDVGHLPDFGATRTPERHEMLAEFGQLTDSGCLSRRQVVMKLAHRYGLPARTVYQEIERAKKSGV